MRKWIAPIVWGILSFGIIMFLAPIFATWVTPPNRPYAISFNTLFYVILFLIGSVCFWGCRISAQLTEQKKMREQDRKPDLPASDEDKAEDHPS